jgi:LysR family transcriptional regulator, regulator for metE and metH
MRLEIRDLRLVSAIADLGNLTRAGQQLHLTQSALSHQLADLEHRIGGVLFERAGRRMVPTRLGEHLRASAKATLAQVSEMERDLVDMANGREALLRLATECYTGYHWLPPVLEAFRAQHPAVDVRIVPEATSHPLRALVAGSIDLAIVTSRGKDRRIALAPLFNDELVLVVGVNHRLAGERVIDPSELCSERFLMYSGPDDSQTFRDILAPAGVSPAQLSVLQLTEAILELVKANMGVTVLARWAVEPYIDSGALRVIRIDHPAVARTWQVATRAGRPAPAFVTDFIGFLARTVAAPPRRQPQFSVIRSVARLESRSRRTAGGK